MLDLPFRADPLHPDPVYRQLADHLAELITAGRLPAGERVPPTRELASALGLSRNTVTRAYEWLIEAGCLGAHVGRGTFVQRAARAERVQRAPDATLAARSCSASPSMTTACASMNSIARCARAA